MSESLSGTVAEPLEPIRRRGIMLVLSSPSGAGKTTVARALLEREENLALSVSATTRPPRPGEIEGRDYFFVDAPEFQRMIENGGFLEHATVFGNRYGTPRGPVEAALEAGQDVLFDVDWQGARQLREADRQNDLVSVFILPPSHGELERRLRNRAQDPDEVVRRRMAMAAAEMSHWNEYDFVVVNRDAEACIDRVRAILAAERRRRSRQTGLADFVAALGGGETPFRG